MKTIDDIAAELVGRSPGADSTAVIMIRLLDYRAELVLDAEAYRREVRQILDAVDRAREIRLAKLRESIAAAQGPPHRPLG